MNCLNKTTKITKTIAFCISICKAIPKSIYREKEKLTRNWQQTIEIKLQRYIQQYT